jgi:hypothetical protein
MARHKEIFKVRKSTTRDVKRKAVQNRSHIERWFIVREKALKELNIKAENMWNFDETGFMVGYLRKETFLWTYQEVEKPILTDAHDTVLARVVEAISTTGGVIDPFIILPGIMVPVKWIINDLPEDMTFTTTPTGYTNDMVAFE